MIPGFLFIQNSQDITNLNGLGCLTSIDGLLIGCNGVLSDLTGLENLTFVGGNLFIGDNAMLSDLTGLDNLTSVGENLIIQDNPMLSDCCVLCPLLTEDNMDDSVIGGSIDINSNLNGCNSEAEVEVCTLCGATPENIPTVQEWGLIILGLSMLIIAVVGIRQRTEEKTYS